MPDSTPNPTTYDPSLRCTCGHTAHWHNGVIDGKPSGGSRRGQGECEADCSCKRFVEAPSAPVALDPDALEAAARVADPHDVEYWLHELGPIVTAYLEAAGFTEERQRGIPQRLRADATGAFHHEDEHEYVRFVSKWRPAPTHEDG